MIVKVCGLSSEKEIDCAAQYGYSAVGIVLHPQSPRFCNAEKAVKLAEYAKGRIKTVGVGLTYREVEEAEPFFDYIQVYEDCVSDKLILAGGEKPGCENFNYYLFDLSRGSGEFTQFPDWLRKYSDRLIISGGLSAANIRDVIKSVRCAGIDVSSGVEKTRGVKDTVLMKEFIEEVKDETSRWILR